jgi:hypothetical protein
MLLDALQALFPIVGLQNLIHPVWQFLQHTFQSGTKQLVTIN